MGMPKTPKAARVAAPAQQSSLAIKREQEDQKKRMRGRFGYQDTIQAGAPATNTTLG
jgi:hypothetical protein